MSNSQEGHIREVAGDSDSVTFEIVDEREPLFETQLVSDADIRYRYRWQDRGHPAPEDFHRVSHLEVLLVSMATDFDGELEAAADEAHRALMDLKQAMADARGLDDQDRQDIMLGNIDALPEVERR
jgi:hypothetical protein